MTKKNHNVVFGMVLTAVLAAIVVFLQLFGTGIHIGPVTFSFVLIPIILGACLVNEYSGLVLGTLFGIIVLAGGISGADAFTNIYFTNAPVITTILCIGKGAIAGYVPGLIFKLLKNKKPVLGVILASISAPILNTSIFILMSLLIKDVLEANFTNGSSVLYFLVVVCAGINFLVELATSAILTPTIYAAFVKSTKHR